MISYLYYYCIQHCLIFRPQPRAGYIMHNILYPNLIPKPHQSLQASNLQQLLRRNVVALFETCDKALILRSSIDD